MKWLNEPTRWAQEGDELTVTADAATDFWRVTGNGHIRDSGHVYGDTLAGEFDLSMRIHGSYGERYDQAGAMVRGNERHWVIPSRITYFCTLDGAHSRVHIEG